MGCLWKKRYMIEGHYGTDTLWCDKDQNFGAQPATSAWDDFADHIRRKRRFILDDNDPDLFDPRYWLPGKLGELEIILPTGTQYFRGRGGRREPHEMGAPPPNRATAGRANPLGIPFLYLATDQKMVVAELRPWRGQEVTVAEFQLNKATRVVDLTRPIGMRSPFDYGDVDLYKIRDTYRILRHLGQVLSQPIDPERAAIDYLPTQYLTEVIRNAGYEGMIYPSALGPGKNLVLFSPEQATVGDAQYFEVTRISYDISGPLPKDR